MKKILIQVFPMLILFAFIFLISCGDEGSINPTATDVSGTVTFVGSSFYSSGGYFAISIYSGVPTSSNPIRSDTLRVVGGTSSYFYRILDLPSGSYYAAVTWIRTNTSSTTPVPVLGTFGCDTSRTCTTHTRFDYPSAAGTGATNITSWTDTTKKLN